MTNRELLRIVTAFRRGIVEDSPDRMCFAVCAPLQGYLACLGVETELVEADFGLTNHVWLKLPDGRIIDPTADQFSGPFLKMPKVYIGPLPEIYSRWMELAGRTESPISCPPNAEKHGQRRATDA